MQQSAAKIPPRQFDARAAEARWRAEWEAAGIYHWDAARPRAETFVVDTPPPTASGALHVGHVFSYTQTDMQARFMRMRGRNIFYPLGWDDNGVPTERRVQNMFHVRCNPALPHDAAAPALQPANAKQRKKAPRAISRGAFLQLCSRVTAEDEQAFQALFKQVGLSVDWRTEYTTVGAYCRNLAQRSFLDLHAKGHAYNSEAPFLWDVDFQMALSQADTVERMLPGAYHRIEFALAAGDGSAGPEGFCIETTRPELLPACVGVAAHPADTRYQHLFGRTAVTPVFHAPVPVFASELASPEKGSGILMVCTFGDQNDVHWWREQKLPLRQVLGRDGRLLAVQFAAAAEATADTFPSLQPQRAAAAMGELQGLPVQKARARMVQLLRESAHSATGGGAPLQGEPRAVQHAVKFYEKGDTPLEILPSRQWFIRLLDKKEALLKKGAEINWHPPHMQQRFRDWTENLNLDWCISRQRHFGVPIPVWYPLCSAGAPQFEAPLLAEESQLPADPMSAAPPGLAAALRDAPGGFRGESDVFDTWFTSSLTPQIASGWLLNPAKHAKLFPADLRPQSHEIIRTWAFYTIAKSLLHEDQAPWRHIAISGWVLDPDRKKMSKSQGNVVTPAALLEKYSADAVRYWAGSARLGADTAYDENVFKVGRRLCTKLWNAAKFVQLQAPEAAAAGDAGATELDRAFLVELRELVSAATDAFENFDYARALQLTEQFFWTRFTDTYLELAKGRLRADANADATAQQSARATLRFGLKALLRMFAPALPFISEEIWRWSFAAESGSKFIHTAPWPSAKEFAQLQAPANADSFAAACAALAAINKAKADAQVSIGRPVAHLQLCGGEAALQKLRPVLADVLRAARAEKHQLASDASLAESNYVVREIQFTETPAAEARA